MNSSLVKVGSLPVVQTCIEMGRDRKKRMGWDSGKGDPERLKIVTIVILYSRNRAVAMRFEVVRLR